MNKKHAKLIAAVLMMLVAFSALVVTSFAWFTISDTPVAEGIQIAIGGSGTILIAPDISQTENGVTYHYPGLFKEQIHFNQWESYDYLKNLAGLSPVSTADGRHWFIPTYYGATDDAVQSGQAMMGQTKPTQEHINDSTLTYANIPEDQMEKAREGSYIYLDFWVVAPGGDYQLRVSAGDKFSNSGSFLIGLPDVVEENGGFHLKDNSGQLSASARIGFLANTDAVLDNSMLYYSRSQYYSATYKKLRGYYDEPGIYSNDSMSDRFTIYEPNGDLHPTTVYNSYGDAVVDGQYAFTKPIGKDGQPVSVQDRLTVQMRNQLLSNQDGLRLEQLFQAFIVGDDMSDPKEMERQFYFDYLQQHMSSYLTRGQFLPNTGALYGLGQTVVSQEQLQGLGTAGATEDVMIVQLEKNVPQRIRMYLWVESQDPDCIGFADSIRFSVGLELAGSN